MAEINPVAQQYDQFGMPQQQLAQKKGGLFSKKEPMQQGADVNQAMAEIGAVSRRVRILEERYNNLRKKSQVSDQHLMNHTKKTSSDFKDVHDEVLGIKRAIEDIKDKMRLIIKELKSTAKSEEISVLQKYIQFWEPVNFVTRNEVERIIEDVLEQKSLK